MEDENTGCKEKKKGEQNILMENCIQFYNIEEK